jgi:hypothetical protein
LITKSASARRHAGACAFDWWRAFIFVASEGFSRVSCQTKRLIGRCDFKDGR